MDFLAMAFGSALAESAIFFPITYLALAKQLNLEPLRAAWRPWGSYVVVRTIVVMLFGVPTTNSVSGVVSVFFVPIFVASLVLLVWSRLGQVSGSTKPKPASSPERSADHQGDFVVDAEQRKLNVKRGLLRLWLVGAVTWIVGLAAIDGVPEKIVYARRYHANYAALKAEQDGLDSLAATTRPPTLAEAQCEQQERARSAKSPALPSSDSNPYAAFAADYVIEQKCRVIVQDRKSVV